jgi:hypothetical protein
MISCGDIRPAASTGNSGFDIRPWQAAISRPLERDSLFSESFCLNQVQNLGFRFIPDGLYIFRWEAFRVAQRPVVSV